MTRHHFLLPAIVLLASAPLVMGQNVISAKAGLVQLAEGQVSIDGKPAEVSFGKYPQIKANAVLSTDDGRAEILLSPGSFLRVAPNSSVTMVSTDLENVKVDVARGTVLLEYGEFTDINSIVITSAGREFQFSKSGLYYLNLEDNTFKVVRGEATVVAKGEEIKLKDGKMVSLNGEKLVATKFDKEASDPFLRWAARRGEAMAQANLTLANVANRRSNGYGGGSSLGYFGFGSYGGAVGNWIYNPYFGMFTYFPYGASYYSPWGYQLYNPRNVWIANQGGYGNASSGFRTSGQNNAGFWDSGSRGGTYTDFGSGRGSSPTFSGNSAGVATGGGASSVGGGSGRGAGGGSVGGGGGSGRGK